MQALDTWNPSHGPIVGLLTDIDDTLTTEGVVPAEVVQSIAALKAKGLAVIPITGRPVGWSVPFAQEWPVDAIVAENGAVALRRNALGGLDKLYQQDDATRIANYANMQAVLEQIEATVPGARRATDSVGRECDIAVDHSEFTHMPQAQIDQCVAIMKAAGMNATVSSIHINGWFGGHNKLEGARWIVKTLFGKDLDAEIGQWCYIGDSTNDQLMFQHFENSFGVANIERFVPQLSHLPRYVTRGERGEGFVELAERLCAVA
ncbi:HAD-IIB family hydrolase [Comamonas odontotermitis]|uniref:HAD-IIB family hydrolase n=1 Tax=Comamonas odontotermitis TaxID=379895 RepID=UPI001CC46D90|nr:HAD-IIB family hydrolase [Comamonas odontotermitis]UBB16734.1 HAD-IIB family hydrolase [Comamonas odontotermitis]